MEIEAGSAGRCGSEHQLVDVVARTRKYYDANASQYFRSTKAVDLGAVWERFERAIRPGARVVDVGCGSGRDLRRFRTRGLHPTGLDSSEPLVILARRFSECEVVHGRIEDLPFEAGRFEGVWAMASLHHLQPLVLPAALAECRRVLAPHGTLFLSNKVGSGPMIDGEGRFINAMRAHEWSLLLKENGFRVKDAREELEAPETCGRVGVRWAQVLAERDR